MSLPVPYMLLESALLAFAKRSPRFYLAARPAYRLAIVTASVLREVARRNDAPKYLRFGLRKDAADLFFLADEWRREVDAWRASPTLCYECQAPRGGSDGGHCPRCPGKQEQESAIEAPEA